MSVVGWLDRHVATNRSVISQGDQSVPAWRDWRAACGGRLRALGCLTAVGLGGLAVALVLPAAAVACWWARSDGEVVADG